jgi:hypothetical protein
MYEFAVLFWVAHHDVFHRVGFLSIFDGASRFQAAKFGFSERGAKACGAGRAARPSSKPKKHRQVNRTGRMAAAFPTLAEGRYSKPLGGSR